MHIFWHRRIRYGLMTRFANLVVLTSLRHSNNPTIKQASYSYEVSSQ